MEITLKNVQYLERGSQETYNFVADIYVNGKLAGYASNDGHGGSNSLHPAYDAKDFEAAKKLFNEAEFYCKALPPIISKYANEDGSDHIFSYDNDLSNYVDELFTEWLRAKDSKKFQAKIQKECISRVVIGNSSQFSSFGWPRFTIADMVTKHDTVLIETLKKRVSEGKINADNRILNTNIPAYILKSAGITEL